MADTPKVSLLIQAPAGVLLAILYEFSEIQAELVPELQRAVEHAADVVIAKAKS